MQRGALYIRVSSQEQTEFSPDAQKRALLSYADSHEIAVRKEDIFTDEGISGRSARKRPAFMHMIASAKQTPKPFDVILCHRFDRFARSREDSIVYKSLLRRECGIQVISITEYMEDDKFSVILEAMLEAMAEYYSLNLSDEVKKGMSEKALRGQYQAAPPFGYEMSEKKLLTVPSQKELYLFMVHQLCHGMRPYAIARTLNSMGAKTKRGNAFESRTVTSILKNRIYCGYVSWNGTIQKCDNEAFITEEEYEKIQVLLHTGRPASGAKPPESLSHWLSGLLYCSSCKGKLASGGQKRQAFQCCNYARGTCSISHHLPYQKITALILDACKELESLDCSEDSKGRLLYHKKEDASVTSQIKLLQTALDKLNDKTQRMHTAYLEGIDTIAEYEQTKIRLADERRHLETALHQYAQHAACSMSDLAVHSLHDILSSELLTKEVKHTALMSVCQNITYDKSTETVAITFVLPEQRI